jgi:hypothetical protein
LARQLFDIGIFSVLGVSSALGVGWKLAFYTGGTTTAITTYNARSGGSANANPVVADANGRFDEIWIEEAQTIKFVLLNAADVSQVTVDNYLITDSPPTISASLEDFLAGSSALPIANGGTGVTSAANAITALGGLPAAGGTVSGDITRSTKGVVPYWDAAGQNEGAMFITASGASDPTSQPGHIWFGY